MQIPPPKGVAQDSSSTPSIPAADDAWQRILSLLEPVRPQLSRNGCVIRRSVGRAYQVRFRERVNGRIIHRSIGIGSNELLAQRAAETIRSWQQPAATQPDREMLEITLRHLNMLDLGVNQRERLLHLARRLAADCDWPGLFGLYWFAPWIQHSRVGRPPSGERWGSIERETRGFRSTYDRDTGRIVHSYYDVRKGTWLPCRPEDVAGWTRSDPATWPTWDRYRRRPDGSIDIPPAGGIENVGG